MHILLLHIILIFPISQEQGDQKNPDVVLDGQKEDLRVQTSGKP